MRYGNEISRLSGVHPGLTGFPKTALPCPLLVTQMTISLTPVKH